MQNFCIPHLLTPLHNTHQKSTLSSVLARCCQVEGSDPETGYMEPQIIIVSGDAQFRDALERVCAGHGHRIETADSVTTGLEVAVRHWVSVMVADASLQVGGDGVGLAKAIHDQNPDMKCFLVVEKNSSYVSNSTDNESWLRFVQRPISMLRFTTDVLEAIEQSTESLTGEKRQPRPQTNRLPRQERNDSFQQSDDNQLAEA